MTGSAASALEGLIGDQLGSVIFVQDYVQLDFDGPRMSLFVWPIVRIAGRSRLFGESGYRDALCGLIASTVRSTLESNEAGLVLHLDAGSVVIKPRTADLTGPEIAVLHGLPSPDDLSVWRPGEPPFEVLSD